MTALAVQALVLSLPAGALTGSDFNPGNIISGAVFTNAGSMSTGDIQNFLNAKTPACDTNGTTSKSYYFNPSSGEINISGPGASYVTTSRAVYGQRYANFWNSHTIDSAGSKRSSTYRANQTVAPYVCLRDYVENETTHANNLQNPGASIPGGVSAAQVIVDAANKYSINPQVLLVALQKEQGLITDDWPWTNEYIIAMGYGCPDTADCDTAFYGFANQMFSAAKQFRRYLSEPNSFNYVVGTNNIYYNVLADCNQYSSVNIQNQSTAALYNYTPYQPNGNVLAHTNPTGSSSGPGGAVNDNCAAYGNRNFWWYFNTWFGSTQTNTPYAWSMTSSVAYADPARTNQYSSSPTMAITPGGKAYITFKARNNGYQTWKPNEVFMGTDYPQNRPSPFADNSWANPARIALQESSVAPGDSGTFSFSLTAPAAAGSYRECFALVAEGKTWLFGPSLCYNIDVVAPAADSNTDNINLSSGSTLNVGSYLMSPSTHSVLSMQGDGNLVVYSNAEPKWNSSTGGSGADHLVMQTDGNLVLYTASGVPKWFTNTSGNPGAKLVIQSDGNLVLYSAGNAPLWMSGSYNTPSFSNTVVHALYGGVLLPQQRLQMADRSRTMLMQKDGNVVLYSDGRPVWTPFTQGNNGAYLVMQSDGNLVVYSANGRPLWFTGTYNNPGAKLILQDDGNLVIYSAGNVPLWQSYTRNR
jgi:hypothetical protein